MALPNLPVFSAHISIQIAPDNLPKFFDEFKIVLEKVRAEPDLMYFEMFQDPEDPGKLSWVENWSKSPEWFMTEQVTKDYYKPYFAATEHMFLKEREVKIFKRLGAPFVFSRPENFA